MFIIVHAYAHMLIIVVFAIVILYAQTLIVVVFIVVNFFVFLVIAPYPTMRV